METGEITLHQGHTPLLISVPHSGTAIPGEMKECMQPETLFLPDTDWFVDRLYGWAPVEGASLLVTPWSRYVIDVNRPPDDTPLYNKPGTALVPLTTFQGTPIYREGREPDEAEIEDRRQRYWQPFHDYLAAELKRIHERHGFAILLDAHSIRSVLPNLFAGELPHLNLGSNEGASADRALIEVASELLETSEFRAVKDARFKGGFITRNYGRPEEGFHAMQLEIAQRTYMPEFPPQWDRARSHDLVKLLKTLVSALQNWRPDRSGDLG